MRNFPSLARLLVLATFLPLLAGAAEAPKRKAPANAGPPPVPPGVTAHRDLAYVKNGHERQTLDLYLPAQGGGAPLVVWIHGGGWQNGSKERTQAMPLLARGYAVASINYRLSSHAVFPAQLEDCKAAIRWLRAHAKDYGYDGERIAAWGSSAGGHLVSMLGVTGGMKEFDRGENLQHSSRVQAVVDFFGPSELLTMDDQATSVSLMRHNAPDSPEAKLLGGPLQQNKDKARRASPLTYVTRDDAPILIVHGDSDPLVPVAQSENFHAALKEAGVDASLYIVKGGGHGGFRDPEVIRRVEEFLDRMLKAKKR